MSGPVFVDTSAWFAAASRGDRYNLGAKVLLAAFDDDFAVDRFGPDRQRAFTLLR